MAFIASRGRESRNRGRVRGSEQQHVAHLKRTKYLCCKLLHTLWHIGALCRAANGKWVTTVPERVCKERGGAVVRCTVIGCPNKALCKRWRSLIAICLNVCYTIFQRLTLCNLSSYPTHSLPLSLHPFHSLLLSAVA